VKLGQAYGALGKWDDDEKEQSAAIALDSTRPEAYRERIKAETNLYHDDALPACNQAVQLDPTDADALSQRGFVEMRQHDYAAALAGAQAAH